MIRNARFVAVCAILLSAYASFADAPKQGKNKVAVRGQQQEVYFVPGAGSASHQKILFFPGDGGWHGFAVTIAENLSAAGYDVYGVDTRHYLQSFTGSTVLKTSEIASDFRDLAKWIQQGSQDRVIVMGWSEGAGLELAAASDPASRQLFAGVVAIGIPEYNILAWRWKDIGAEITKSLPNEPTFKSIDFIGSVSPLPLYVIASTGDEYIKPATTQALFNAARQPKQLVVINGGDHKYSNVTDEFFRKLKEGLTWIQHQQR